MNGMIKNLIFDFGKVLVDYDFDAFFRKHISDAERRRAVKSVIYNEKLQTLLDRETKSFDKIMEDFIRVNTRYEHEIRLFMELYPELVTGEVPGMRDVLTRLKAEGFRLYGLTNWCSKVYVTMEQFGIFRLLDGQVISSEEHAVKPEAGIYGCLFRRFGLDPAECIFTDDRPENIEGGRAFGMDGIVFSGAARYERELRSMLERHDVPKGTLFDE